MSLADACSDFLWTMWEKGVSTRDLAQLREDVAKYADDTEPGGYPPEAIALFLAAIDEQQKPMGGTKMDIGTFVSLVTAVFRTSDDLPDYPEEKLAETMRQLWRRHPEALKAKPG